MGLLKKRRRFRIPPFTVRHVATALSEQVDWGLSANNIPNHWAETQGEGIKVAVLDTGYDTSHPEFVGAVTKSRNFTRSKFGVMDRQGHGTHTAGTVGARKNNIGVIGVAPKCDLLIGKVLGDDGSGDGREIAQGIRWAVDEGADIISQSYGSFYDDPNIIAAEEYAAKHGVLLPCAAGNDGRPNSVNSPARLDICIAVTAVDRNGRLASFSSQGAEADIAAPGEDILSAWLNGTYAKLNGTSMACPFVAGTLALLLAMLRKHNVPKMTFDEITAMLRDRSTDAGPTGKDPQYGWGLINPDSLLQQPKQPEQPSTGINIGVGKIHIPARAGDWFSVGAN